MFPTRVASPVLSIAVTAAAVGVTSPSAFADGPHAGTPTVVTVGDSYISGEGGRWAGNSNVSSTSVDALGSTAYNDNTTRTAETIDRCHRSTESPAHLGNGVDGLNLACSGATTQSHMSSDRFKPGLDFYDDGAGHLGQAKLLQEAATTHHVTSVAVTIGGNDFSFPSVVQNCVTDFLGSSSLRPNYCNDDTAVASNFTPSNIATVRARVVNSLQNIRTAMRNAGYEDGSWNLIAMTYPLPLAPANALRYRQSGYVRQSVGGCGFWDQDADWAANTALPTMNSTLTDAASASGVSPVVTVDMSQALAGHRLCEKGVDLMEKTGQGSWQSPGAVDSTEWVTQVRTASTVVGPYYVQESLHPNHWGQLAQRNCLRQAYNGGTPRSGVCTRSGDGLVNGEPAMSLH